MQLLQNYLVLSWLSFPFVFSYFVVDCSQYIYYFNSEFEFKYAVFLYIVRYSVLAFNHERTLNMTYEEFKEKVGSIILTENENCPVTPVIGIL